MQLQTIRPNIVQAIRAYRVEDLMASAQAAGQHVTLAGADGAQVLLGQFPLGPDRQLDPLTPFDPVAQLD